jgi:aldehyde:ferredoxin oxidoreductase
MELDKRQLSQIAANITNLAREFNRREGVTSRDDRLPKRFLEEKLSDSGRVLPQSEFEKMLEDYYRLRGWGPRSGD